MQFMQLLLSGRGAGGAGGLGQSGGAGHAPGTI